MEIIRILQKIDMRLRSERLSDKTVCRYANNKLKKKKNDGPYLIANKASMKFLVYSRTRVHEGSCLSANMNPEFPGFMKIQLWSVFRDLQRKKTKQKDLQGRKSP